MTLTRRRELCLLLELNLSVVQKRPRAKRFHLPNLSSWKRWRKQTRQRHNRSRKGVIYDFLGHRIFRLCTPAPKFTQYSFAFTPLDSTHVIYKWKQEKSKNRPQIQRNKLITLTISTQSPNSSLPNTFNKGINITQHRTQQLLLLFCSSPFLLPSDSSNSSRPFQVPLCWRGNIQVHFFT